jgi:hypothetical protein
MNAGGRWLAAPEARWVVLAAALAVGAAYLVQRPVQIDVGASPLATACLRGFWGSEGGYRWSRERSAIVFPDPGPGIDVRVELDVAGWRPRGQETPSVDVNVGPGRLKARPSPRGETLSLEARTSGVWNSDLVVAIESPTFEPGPQDPRALGIRVYAARLLPLGGAFGLRRPPLGQVVTSCLVVLLFFGLLVRAGVETPAASRAAFGLAAAAGLGFAFARPHAALASRPSLILVAVLTVLAHLAPRAAATIADVCRASLRSFARGLRAIATVPGVALAVAGALAVAWTYRARPSIEIDLGSGRETAIASGFGAFDSHAGATFRPVQRGAQLDLRDFGSGPWSIAVTASAASDTPRLVDLARTDGSDTKVRLDDRWFTASLDATAPFGWRSGLVVSLPGGSEPTQVRIDKIRIDRPSSRPSLRIVVAGVAAALLLAVALVATGLAPGPGFAAAALVLAAETAALVADPAVVIPFVVPFCAIAALGAVLTAFAAGVCHVLERRGTKLLPAAAALAAAGAGFVAWLAATAFPLYRGGHFVFHSSIAAEIWKGRFLIYYLPFPGSMLSQQAQWGQIVVPHPCFEQTLMAPLAALPQPWFHLAEKAVLALWLASMAVMAALLATRAAGARAGAWAAIAMAGLVPTFQLLGLGHLMALCGCWAASVAFTYLAFRLDRLAERRTFWIAVVLFTVCFLSYFAALLFGGLVLLLLVAALFRREPARARTLLLVALAASIAAFLLYYVNWTWPFLSQSVPRILAGSSRTAEEAGTPILRRLLLEPRKLAYSYGTVIVPLVGLAGLAWRVRTPDRIVLLAWASVLVLVSGIDLWFNFLLKHHYFVMVPVAVGVGLVLAWLTERGRAGRIAAVVLAALYLALGAETAMAVALGLIP